MSDESVDKLSRVLSSLREMHASDAGGSVRQVMAAQIDVLREVQVEMQLQLRLHDAQIAALRELIAVVTERSGR